MRLVGFGALGGLTWGASLRGWMVDLAGASTRFTWYGTFVCVLGVSAVIGALLAWSEHLRRVGHARPKRWLVFVPLLFPIGPLLIPGAIAHLLATGQGTASAGMVLLAMLAAYALTSRRAVWWRAVCGIVGFAIVPAMLAGAAFTPKDLWAAVLFSALFVVLALACALPQRSHSELRARQRSAKLN